MKSDTVFRLLRQFSPRELKRFTEFLDSPYHNKTQKKRAFWAMIKPYAPDFDEMEMAKLDCTDIYPGTNPIEKAKVLAKDVENFLTQQRFGEDQYYRKHLFLEELLRLKEKKGFEEHYKKTCGQLDGVVVRDKEFYQSKYLIEYDYMRYLGQTQQDKDKILKQVDKANEALDAAYVLPKLILSSELENLKYLAKSPDFHSELLPDIALLMEKGWMAGLPSHRAQYLTFRLVSRGAESDFEALYDYLEKNEKLIARDELFTCYILCINFLIKMLREKKDYDLPLFHLYQKLLWQETLMGDGFLSPTHLKNMVTIGCRLSHFEEASSLLEEFKEHLNPEYRTSAYHFCHGVIAYRQGNYDKALDHLHEAESTPDGEKTIFYIDAGFVRQKIYYLVEEWERFSAMLPTFRQRIYSSNLSEGKRDSYLNFCIVLNQMYKKKSDPNSKVTKQALLEQIEGFPKVSDKNWLLEEIGKLD